jgi:cytochrome bd-type quinol oxidase subunit 1
MSAGTFSTAMVALGTTLSAFWIMVNNTWMQVPVGYVVQNGAFVRRCTSRPAAQTGAARASRSNLRHKLH